MSNTIKLGNLNISSFRVGGSDCSIYLGTVKVYPQDSPTPTAVKFSATYTGGATYSAECDGSSELTTATTKPSGYQYTGMTSAVIGDCITSIGGYTFANCSGLTSVTIPSGVTNINMAAFQNCSGLTTIDIPSGLRSIGTSAFQNCGITSVTIPNSMIFISNRVFYDCSNLASVTILNGVTEIFSEAFYNCSGLTSITIPNSVTNIGDYAFSHCYGLTSATIGSGVTSIGNGCFQFSNHLTGITIEAINPPTVLANAFDATNDCPIYVHSVDAYKASAYWSNYSSRLVEIPT